MAQGQPTVVSTLGRYLGGALIVAVLVVSGVALRVMITAGQDQRQGADAIVVLGAAQYDGDPSVIFEARLSHALELYQTGVAPHIVTVGGNQQGDQYTEAEAGKAWLLAHGVPADAVIAVGEGGDTLVSLRAGVQLLDQNGWNSVVLVTDPWHAYRASRMAADLGLSVQVSSVDTGPATSSSIVPGYLVRETLGSVFYRLFGGSSGLGTPVL